MTRLVLTGALAVVMAWSSPVAAQSGNHDLKEWDVEWGGRTRDPAVAPDGKVWFVGQAGNYVASFDPKTEQFKRYEIEEGTNPHTVVVDETGLAWYAGNRNGRIGRIDPASGGIKTFMTGEARDPHTMVFDGKGHIWFTSQARTASAGCTWPVGRSISWRPTISRRTRTASCSTARGRRGWRCCARTWWRRSIRPRWR